METRAPDRWRRAAAILDEFAAATGLTSQASARRYLWTDAFAVITWVALSEREGEARFLTLARTLVDQVHRVLGAHCDDPEHPTVRGLRIGKALPERPPGERYDPQREWDRDGQYYHYLTKWMLALQRLAGASGEPRYQRWAAELCETAHRAFAYPKHAPQRLYWKMSVDLSRPLVDSMGAHDPLDGLIEATSLGLARVSEELLAMCLGRTWTTDDPLGAGQLLIAALRLRRLVEGGHGALEPLYRRTSEDAAASAHASASRIMQTAAEHQLPFRELGFALGLHAVRPLRDAPQIERVERFVPLAGALETYWCEAANQVGPVWTAHGDINAVTLASCLVWEGVLQA